MSDAFKNYNNLISGLNQADQFKDEGVRAVAETKAKADEIGKSLGEVKSFMAGTHGAKSFVKDIKPILKKRAKRLADRAKSEIEARIKGKVNEVQQRIQNAKQNAEDRVAQAKENVENRLNGEAPSNLDTPNTDAENPTQNVNEEENGEPEAEEIGEDAVADDFGEGATLTMTHFGREDKDNYEPDEDDFDDWDSPWGDDTIAEGRAGTFSNPVANSRNASLNPNEADSQSLDDLANGTLKTTTFDGTFPTAETTTENLGSTAGQATKQVTSDTLDTSLADDSVAKTAVKQTVEKTVAKTAGKATAEEAGGEAATGVLDAIPGLDVLGFIGGAILTAIEAHKQRKEEREEAEGAGQTPTQAVQVGVGGE